jgi:hypothetical protein
MEKFMLKAYDLDAERNSATLGEFDTPFSNHSGFQAGFEDCNRSVEINKGYYSSTGSHSNPLDLSEEEKDPEKQISKEMGSPLPSVDEGCLHNLKAIFQENSDEEEDEDGKEQILPNELVDPIVSPISEDPPSPQRRIKHQLRPDCMHKKI